MMCKGLEIPAKVASAISKLRKVKEESPKGFVGVSPNKPVWHYKSYWPFSSITDLFDCCACMCNDIHVYDFSQQKIVAGFYFDNVKE